MVLKFLTIFSVFLFVGSSYAEGDMAGASKTPTQTKPQASNLDGFYKKPSNLTTENLGQYPGECQIAVGEVEELCWKEGILQNASAGISSARDKTTGLTGMLEGASEDTKMGAIMHLKAAQSCQQAIKSCSTSCVSADVNTYLPKTAENSSTTTIQAELQERIKNKKEATKYCKVSKSKVGVLADNAVRMFNQSDKLQALKNELDTGIDSRSFYEKHKTKILVGGGAAAAVGGYMIGKSKGEDDGKKSALSDLRYNCFSNGKWDSPECKNEYKTVCSEDPKAEGCYAFTNSYCGISGNVTQATGADTQFCDSMNSYRYCQQDGAANSPTCVEKRVSTGTCQSDKAVDPSLECRIYNHQQLAQQVCRSYPNDPICRQVLGGGSSTSYSATNPAAGASSYSGANVGSGSSGGVMGYAMSAGSSNNVIPNNQRKPSSNSDVSCAACASVFSQISRVAQEYCSSGQLYGCYKK